MRDSKEPDLEMSRRVRRARRVGDVATLIEALDYEVVSPMAAQFLGRVGDPAAIPALLPLLLSANPDRRAGAAIALGQLDAGGAAADLRLLALEDPVGWVRSSAAEALRRLSEYDATQVAFQGLRDAHWGVRRVAVMTLMDSGRPDAIDPLREAMRREPWYARGIYRKAIRRVSRAS